MASANPIIKGFMPEWSEIEFSCLGGVYLGIKSINYDTDSDGADVMGAHPEAIARTVGSNKHTADFEMYLPDAAVLLAKLGDDYRTKPFDININFRTADQGYLTSDVLVGCLIKKVGNAHQQGSDALTRKFDIRPFRIKRSTLVGTFPIPNVTDVQDPFA